MRILIIFILSLLCLPSSVNASNTSNYWVQTHEDNISIVEQNNNEYQLVIKNMLLSDYYLFTLKDTSDNDIDYTIKGGSLSTQYVYDFKKFSQNLFTNLSYDDVDILKPSANEILITFTSMNDFKYSLLEKNYNKISFQINDDTTVINDLLILNGNVVNHSNDEIRLVTIGLGKNDVECIYLYIYVPSLLSLNDEYNITLAHNSNYDTQLYEVVGSYNNIYKMKLELSKTDFFDTYNNFQLVDFELNQTSTSSLLKSCTEILDQYIFFENVDGDVEFGTVDSIKNVVDGVYYNYDIYEENRENWYSMTTTDRTRFHYILFDIYIANEKLTSDAILNEIVMNYTMSYKPYERTANGGEIVDMTRGDTPASNYWGSIQEAVLESYYYTTVENYTETIISKDYSFTFKPKESNFATWFNGTVQKVDFNQLDTIDKNKTFSDLEFNNKTFALFFGDGALGYDSLAHSKKTTDFIYTSMGNIATDNIDWLPVADAESIDFVTVDYSLKGINYKVTIDETNITYGGVSDEIPGEHYEENNNFFSNLWDDVNSWFTERFADIYIAIETILLITCCIVLGIFAIKGFIYLANKLSEKKKEKSKIKTKQKKLSNK